MSRNSEYNANLSLNETAKENKRWAHTHVPKPQPITRKRKLANLVTEAHPLQPLFRDDRSPIVPSANDG